jgi:hypothetical protein
MCWRPSTLPALLLLVAVGCASQKISTTKIGVIHNRAGALYGYGVDAVFQLISEPVQVEIRAPIGLVESWNAAGQLADHADNGKNRSFSTHGITAEGSLLGGRTISNQVGIVQSVSVSGESKETTFNPELGVATVNGTNKNAALIGSQVEDANAGAISGKSQLGVGIQTNFSGASRSQAAQGQTEGMVVGPEGDHAAFESKLKSTSEVGQEAASVLTNQLQVDARGGQLQVAVANSSSREHAQRGVESGSNAKALLVPTTHVGIAEGSSLHSEMTINGLATSVQHNELASLSRSSEAIPRIRKSASTLTALVEEPFEFVIQLDNTTPLALGSIEIVDRLDSWLVPLLKGIHTEGGGVALTKFEDNELLITINGGVPRHKTLVVHIPVVASAEAIRQGLQARRDLAR